MPELMKVMLDAERMKYPHTGLYHFCYQLGRTLMQQAGGNRLSVYAPPQAQQAFGTGVSFLSQRSLHKFRFPSLADTQLWHCTYQGSNYFPFRKKVKIVMTMHDLNFMYEHKPEEKKQRYLHQLKRKVERADHIVAISQFVLNDLKRFIDIKSKPASVIYNGCNIVEIKELQPPLQLPDKPFLFTIGTIVNKKNFHVLPCLLQGNDDRLIIAGIVQSEAYKQQILAEARKYNVEDRVVFTGPVSENDKQWYYKHCKAFVFPSIAEGFGLPVVEAMYFGKPVVLSTHTSLPEIGGELAYYFPSFEADAMQQSLINALKQHDLKNNAEAIREHALSFSWSEAAKQYWKVYEEVLSVK